MNLSKRSKEPHVSQGQEQNTSSIWNSLGQITSELRMIEYRLYGAGKTDVHSIGNNLGHDSTDNVYLPPHHGTVTTVSASTRNINMPTFGTSSGQSLERLSSVSPLSGARCKAIRKVDKTSDVGYSKQMSEHRDYQVNLHAKSLAGSRYLVHSNCDHNEIRVESPIKKDFLKTHQLEEVNGNDAYIDSLSRPADSCGSGSNSTINSTTMNSCYIRETDIHFLNFSCIPGSTSVGSVVTVPASTVTSTSENNNFTSPPFASLPSVSNSVSDFTLILPPSISSLSPPLTFSLLPTVHPTKQPDVRWNQHVKVPVKSSYTSATRVEMTGSGKKNENNIVRKLTHVDLKVAGSSRTGHPVVSMLQESSAEQKHKELLRVRKQLQEKWTQLPQRLLNKPNRDSKQLLNKPNRDSKQLLNKPNRDSKQGGHVIMEDNK